MIENGLINTQIAKIRHLPPLPEISIKIINAVNDPEVSVEALVEVISLSPVLTARLLGLANSAFFGRSGKIDDLRIAIIQVLGLNLVKSLALSIVLNVELDISKCKGFNADSFWFHGLTTALIAQRLAVRMNDPILLPNTVYTSGLLLNIGILVAVFILPEQMQEVFFEFDPSIDSVSEKMTQNIGKTQYDLGGMLLERWKLPDVYKNTVMFFLQKNYSGEEKTLINLLQLSHRMGAYIVYGDQEETSDYSEEISALSLETTFAKKVLADVLDNKENIQELANIVSG